MDENSKKNPFLNSSSESENSDDILDGNQNEESTDSIHPDYNYPRVIDK